MILFGLLGFFLGLVSSETCSDGTECSSDRFCCELDMDKYTCCPDPTTYEFPCYITSEDMEEFFYGFFRRGLLIPVSYSDLSSCLSSGDMLYTTAYLCGAYRDLKDQEYSLITYGLYNLAMFSHNLISALNTCKPEYAIWVTFLDNGIDKIVNSNYAFELDVPNKSFKINGINLYYNVFGDPNDSSIFGFVDAWDLGYPVRAGHDIGVIVGEIADWRTVSGIYEAISEVDASAYASENSVITKNQEYSFVDLRSDDKDECDSKRYNQDFLEDIVSGVLVVFDFEYNYDDIKTCLSEEDEKQIFEWGCYIYKEADCLLSSSCDYESNSITARDMISYSGLLTELATVALLDCENTPPVLALAIQNGIKNQYKYDSFNIDLSEHEIIMRDINIFSKVYYTESYYRRNYPYYFGQMVSMYTFINTDWREVLDMFDPERKTNMTDVVGEIDFISKNDDLGFVASIQIVSEFLKEIEGFELENIIECTGDLVSAGYYLHMAKEYASSLSDESDNAAKTISLMSNMLEALLDALDHIYSCDEDSSIKQIENALLAVLNEDLITMEGENVLVNNTDVTATFSDLVQSFNENKFTTVGTDFGKIVDQSLDLSVSGDFGFGLDLVPLGLLFFLIAN